jgi:hypothetical protein
VPSVSRFQVPPRCKFCNALRTVKIEMTIVSSGMAVDREGVESIRAASRPLRSRAGNEATAIPVALDQDVSHQLPFFCPCLRGDAFTASRLRQPASTVSDYSIRSPNP